MSVDTNEVSVEVAGVPADRLPLRFDPTPCSCGGIEDGVVFQFAGQGCWVVPFEELKRLVKLASDLRGAL